MIALLLLLGGTVAIAAASSSSSKRAPTHSMMRNMTFSHVDTRGRAVFVATAGGPVGDVVCPTGETCKHACACSGVSASGVVGVGGKCKCISVVRPPNPSSRPGLGFRARRR